MNAPCPSLTRSGCQRGRFCFRFYERSAGAGSAKLGTLRFDSPIMGQAAWSNEHRAACTQRYCNPRRAISRHSAKLGAVVHENKGTVSGRGAGIELDVAVVVDPRNDITYAGGWIEVVTVSHIAGCVTRRAKDIGTARETAGGGTCDVLRPAPSRGGREPTARVAVGRVDVDILDVGGAGVSD